MEDPKPTAIAPVAAPGSNGEARDLPAIVTRGAQTLVKMGLEPEQAMALHSRTPDEFLYVRKGREGKLFTYVELNYIVGMLNYVFGHRWSDEYSDYRIGKKMISVRCKLTVHFSNGPEIHHEATGGQPIAKDKTSGFAVDLGDSLKGAEADALKKAASKFGIAWDVYAGITMHPDATPKEKVSAAQSHPRRAKPAAKDPAKGEDVAQKRARFFFGTFNERSKVLPGRNGLPAKLTVDQLRTIRHEVVSAASGGRTTNAYELTSAELSGAIDVLNDDTAFERVAAKALEPKEGGSEAA